jgi:nucleolar protein 14
VNIFNSLRRLGTNLAGQRRQGLLIEMQRRNKVGGILDRRFGEDDPTMAPEDKMMERFVREKQRSHKKSAMFDLEDDEPTIGLTHMGRSLELNGPALVDDYEEEEDDGSGSESDSSIIRKRKQLKRMRFAEALDELEAEDETQPDRKKTKQEVMKEVIAKSKLYKYERQAAKEEDDDLRVELDKEFASLQELLFTGKSRPSNTHDESIPPISIAGIDKSSFEKEFDLRIKKLAMDKRAKPTERTKTEEEQAEDESTRLKELEERRLKRMRGEKVSDDEDESEPEPIQDEPTFQFIDGPGEDFGLGKGIKMQPTAAELGFDDEDDFVIEESLVASGSDMESLSSNEDSEEEDTDAEGVDDDDDDDEFTSGLLTAGEVKTSIFEKNSLNERGEFQDTADGLPYTFPCPQNLDEWLNIARKYPDDKLVTIIRRIRALYHPRLDSKNKEKLSNFSRSLVDYIALNPAHNNLPQLSIIEDVIRHIHSLAKTFPIEIATQFRKLIEQINHQRPTNLHRGDIILLTAISSIFPTSDHFHQVATPAILTIARYLGQKVPKELTHYATGTYLAILAIQSQRLSKRYIPELMNFCLNTLYALAPLPAAALGSFPAHEPPPESRVSDAKDLPLRKLKLSDCSEGELDEKELAIFKLSIICTTVQILEVAADIWTGKSAFIETFEPVQNILSHLNSPSCGEKFPAALKERIEKATSKIQHMLKIAQLARRPLQLHYHRSLAIKTYIPKFEDSFDPNKHYDPDRDRAELAKLKAEHKRERKGAMRELRKDANFVAREGLRAKKARDEAYEKKYKRLVAEIQSEEGREANAYEREKQARKRSRGR